MANSKFAESDAYLSALIEEVRTLPPPSDMSLAMGRRTFFKVAGAAGAGLVLGFHLDSSAFAATATADNRLVMNAYIRIAPDNTITIYSKAPEMRPGHQDRVRVDHRR